MFSDGESWDCCVLIGIFPLSLQDLLSAGPGKGIAALQEGILIATGGVIEAWAHGMWGKLLLKLEIRADCCRNGILLFPKALALPVSNSLLRGGHRHLPLMQATLSLAEQLGSDGTCPCPCMMRCPLVGT